MKHNKLKICGLIAAMPLLMANSPAPTAKPYDYKDATFTCTSSVKHESDNAYDIEGVLKNTGSSFLVTRLKYKDDHHTDYVTAKVKDNFFSNDLVICAGEEQTVIGTGAFDWSTADADKITYEAYTMVEEVEVTVTPEIVLKEYGADYYQYEVTFSLAEKLSSKYVSAIYSIEIEENTYHVLDSRVRYRFSTTQELDLTKAKLKNVTIVKKDTSNSSGGINFANIGLFLLKLFGYAFLFIFCLGFFIIAPAIVIPKLVRNAKRRKERNAQNKD